MSLDCLGCLSSLRMNFNLDILILIIILVICVSFHRDEGLGNLLVLRDILITYAAFHPGKNKHLKHWPYFYLVRNNGQISDLIFILCRLFVFC